MKVYIGPYRSWIGTYQIANLLRYVGFSKDTCWKFGEWLDGTWIGGLCSFIDDKKNRKIKIRIDKYDTWNMDHTLALIILPMLKQLKQRNHGFSYVDDEDVPKNLRNKKKKFSDENFGVIENSGIG